MLLHAGHDDPPLPISNAPEGQQVGPHPDDPVKRDEHLALLALVADRYATDRAIASGDWSDPATWEAGKVPDQLAHVVIGAGVTVVVDGDIGTTYHTMRVDGTLSFATDRDTSLKVDTLVVAPGGTLNIGTARNPVAPQFTARLIIADTGEIDRSWDPLVISRGLVSHGTVSMYGSPKTSFTTLLQHPKRGDTFLRLTTAPSSWRVGDRIILPGTNPNHNEDESLEILGIYGYRVRVAPLQFDHAAPLPGLRVHVANLTRNVIVESQNPDDISRRGHVMFMHNPAVSINYVQFHELGRTDKKNFIEDPVLNADGTLVPGTGTNPRGRYAVHFHRTGLNAAIAPATVRGSVVDGSPGWGFVNHSSHVIVQGSVSHNVVGAGFVSEVGNEIGAFRDNIAIRSEGSGQNADKRQFIPGREDDPLVHKNDDFGHGGHGFWLQGPGVEVAGNVAVGHRNAGFTFWLRGMREHPPEAGQADASSMTSIPNFPAANVVGQDDLVALADEHGMVQSEDVRLRKVKGNTTYASAIGLDLSRHQMVLPLNAMTSSVIEDFLAWNLGDLVNVQGDAVDSDNEGSQGGNQGMTIRYAKNVVIRNARLYGSTASPSGVGINRNLSTESFTIENARVTGFEVGVRTARVGRTTVRSGFLNNLRDIEVFSAAGKAEQNRIAVDISGVNFGDLANFDDQDLVMKLDATDGFTDLIFQNASVILEGRQVMFLEQDPDAVPFATPSAAARVGDEYFAKTSREIWDEFHVAVAGTLAPEDAIQLPRIAGLVLVD